MAQLPLALPADPPPAFTNFVDGRNAEVVAALQALAVGGRAQRAIYLWGAPGAGKTHLLRALQEAAGPARAPLLGPESPLAEFTPAAADVPSSPYLLLIDDCDRLDAERQEFVLNRIGGGQTLITCCEDDGVARCAVHTPPLLETSQVTTATVFGRLKSTRLCARQYSHTRRAARCWVAVPLAPWT